MTANSEELELKDRLSLIESMIAEGRRTTESYGWTFVLWGVAYYVAIAWSSLCKYGLAWPITMISACVLMALIVWLRQSKCGYKPKTTKYRAISAAWISMAISMFVLLDALGFSGKLADERIFVAVAATLVGTANATSSIILKWKLQFACAVVWWAAAVISCFGTGRQGSIAFLIAIFLCQIVFGVYLMIREANARRQGANHA
jgi:O-antigen/teichoic acid export membrane protein